MDEWSSPEFMRNPEEVAKRDVEWLESMGVNSPVEHMFFSRGAYVGSSSYQYTSSSYKGGEVRVQLPASVHVQDPWKDGTYAARAAAKTRFDVEFSGRMDLHWLSTALDKGLADEPVEVLTYALCEALRAMNGRVADALVAMGADVNMAVPDPRGRSCTGEDMAFYTPLMVAVRSACGDYVSTNGSSRASNAFGRNCVGGWSGGTDCRQVQVMDAVECLLNHGASPMEAVLFPLEHTCGMSRKAARPKSALFTMVRPLVQTMRYTVHRYGERAVAMDDREVAASSVAICGLVEEFASRFPGFMDLLKCAGFPVPLHILDVDIASGSYGRTKTVDAYIPSQFATCAMYSGCRPLIDLASGLGLVPMSGKPFAVSELEAVSLDRNFWDDCDCLSYTSACGAVEAAFSSCTMPAGQGRNVVFAAASMASRGGDGPHGDAYSFRPETAMPHLLCMGGGGIHGKACCSTLDTAQAYGVPVDSTAPWCREGVEAAVAHNRCEWVHGPVHSTVSESDWEKLDKACARLPMEYALENGADLEARRDGMTPLLHLAYEFASAGSSSNLRSRLLGMARTLLEYGADPNALTDYSKTPGHSGDPVVPDGMDAIGVVVHVMKRIRDEKTLFQRARYDDCASLVTALVCSGLSTENRLPDGRFPEDGWQHPLAMFIEGMRKRARRDREETLGSVECNTSEQSAPDATDSAGVCEAQQAL